MYLYYICKLLIIQEKKFWQLFQGAGQSAVTTKPRTRSRSPETPPGTLERLRNPGNSYWSNHCITSEYAPGQNRMQ